MKEVNTGEEDEFFAPEIIECVICQQPAHPLYDWNNFHLYKCAHCGTEATHPIPGSEDLQRFYQGISGKKMVQTRACITGITHAFALYLDCWKRYSKRNTPDAFIDVGGGVGYYVHAAMNAGVDATLMDYAQDALNFASEQLGVKHTIAGDIQHCAEHLDGRKFDFVLSRHTIEHMRDPDKFVHNLAQITTAGGMLAIETPNIESCEQFAHLRQIALHYRLLRQYNPAITRPRVLMHALSKSHSGCNPPKHLWGLTERSLKLILERHGFEIVMVNKPIAGHEQFDPLFYEYSRLSTRKGLGKPYYFFERVVSKFFAKNGSNLAIMARKRSS